MVIDHIGYYLLPEQIEWRIIGRIGMPIWIFLIGYAISRDIKLVLTGGIILLIGNMILGIYLLPLDILITITIIRLLMDPMGHFIKKHPFFLILFGALSAVLMFQTYPYFDYGTAAFLFAILGYLVRNRGEFYFSKFTIVLFMLFAVGTNIFFQYTLKDFTTIEAIIMSILMLTTGYLLIRFKSEVYDLSFLKKYRIIIPTLQLMGRRTFELYIVQMFFFKIMRIIIQ